MQILNHSYLFNFIQLINKFDFSKGLNSGFEIRGSLMKI